MEEKDILLKTIEGLNASIASLSTTNKNQSEQIKNLQERKESVEVRKQNRWNRKMIEDLPVLETDTIEPKGVDLSLYRRIGEEIIKVVKHKPGMLYVKVIIRPKYALKDSTLLPPAGHFLQPDRKA